MPGERRRAPRASQAERAATLGAIETDDTAAVLLHHSVADAEAEARAFADGFRCVEGIEDFVRLVHAGAGVGKFDDYICLSRRVRMKRTPPPASFPLRPRRC